jgi:hypothetical protein
LSLDTEQAWTANKFSTKQIFNVGLSAWKLTGEARGKKARIAKEKKSSTTNFARPFFSVLCD